MTEDRSLISLEDAAAPFYGVNRLFAWARRTDAPRPHPFIVGIVRDDVIYFDSDEVDELIQYLWEVVHKIRVEGIAPDWWYHLDGYADDVPVYRRMLDHLEDIDRRQLADH